jgi:hypothetical protein
MTEVMEKTKGQDSKITAFRRLTGLKFSATTMKRTHRRWFAAPLDVRRGYEGNLGPNALFSVFMKHNPLPGQAVTTARQRATRSVKRQAKAVDLEGKQARAVNRHNEAKAGALFKATREYLDKTGPRLSPSDDSSSD